MVREKYSAMAGPAVERDLLLILNPYLQLDKEETCRYILLNKYFAYRNK